MKRFADWLIARTSRRLPDFTIGNARRPYLLRWYLTERHRCGGGYLHNFRRSDDDSALHDHPWPSCSIILRGSYYEVMPAFPRLWPEDRTTIIRYRRAGDIVFRGAMTPHRVVLPEDDSGDPIECWSLFLVGPRLRDWGFWCPQGWRHWEEFVARRADGAGGCE